MTCLEIRLFIFKDL